MASLTESYVLFELAGSTYGVPSRNVQHLELFEHVTLVPNANPAIDGVVFSRGQVIPALNLRARFGFAREAQTLRTRIVFVQVGDRAVGLIVDSAREFRGIPVENIRPMTESLSEVSGHYVKSVAKIND